MKSDEQLYTDIMEKLKFEPDINVSNITLAIHEGIVTLTGNVGHYAQKRRIERAVRYVQGVKGIANELKVDLMASLQRSDTDIAKAASDALAWDVNVPMDKVKVTVADGNLKLTGEVNWHYQRKSAEKAVRNLIGVKSIDNQIKVKPQQAIITSTEVKDKILKEFERNAILDAQGIQVETSGSKITLKGTIHSWAEQKEATRAAWSIPGVTQVENQLMLSYE